MEPNNNFIPQNNLSNNSQSNPSVSPVNPVSPGFIPKADPIPAAPQPASAPEPAPAPVPTSFIPPSPVVSAPAPVEAEPVPSSHTALWILALIVTALIFGGGGYLLSGIVPKTETTIAPTTNEVTIKTYENTAWGYSFTYPSDYVVFSGISSDGTGVIPPNPENLNEVIKIAKNDNGLFCCEPAILEIRPGINENMSLAQWHDMEKLNHSTSTGNEIISSTSTNISGMEAIELTGGGNLGSFYKIVMALSTSSSLEIIQNQDDETLNKIRASIFIRR